MSTRTCREAIQATLAGINGEDGGYTYNLSAPKQVQAGKFERPPTVAPFCCVWTAQVEEDFGPRLDEREQTGTYMVLAWVNPAPKHAGSRQGAAEDLLDDMRRALRANPRLSGTCQRFLATSQPYEDAAAQGTNRASFGVVMMSITAFWRE